MKKNRILLLPFFVGLVLMIYSWYLSYPLSVVSASDFVFNHVSFFYWLGLPILLISMFLMALTTKSIFLKWILSIGIVLAFFSLCYFYSMMPTGDSQLFRGFTEYFMKTKSLDPSQANHNYYQWPAYFVLAEIVTSVSGLTLTNYQFLLFTLIGVLLATALFVYGSEKHINGGVIVVTAFFISIGYYFLDFQGVPFSLALVLLFLLFMLDAHQKSIGVIVSTLLLYASLLFTHLFVPLFFVLYVLFRSLFDKNKQNKTFYRNFSLIVLVSYFLIQITLAKFSFGFLVKSIIKPPVGSVSYFVSAASTTIQNPINSLAQIFSRTVTIAAIIICIAGLSLLLIKRKTNALDKAILLSGLAYSSLGVVLNTLGYRAIAVAFVPISMGAAFLFQGKFKPYFTVLFSVLMVLFLFVPLHNSFNIDIEFQTTENHVADNFFLNHYNWKNPGSVVADFWTNTYLTTQLTSYEYINQNLGVGAKADAVLYTPQFVGLKLGNYSSMASLSEGERLDLLYNDGISYVLINPSH